MNFEAHTTKKALVFGLDDVIFPKKDYLLQVYYLFAQFIEYTEQLDSGPIIEFMRDYFETRGQANIFKETALKFEIPLKYEENFNQLHKSAKLPLKLLLFKNVLSLMQDAHKAGKLLILLANGDLETQLNKIRQIEWNGLETAVKVYFPEELRLTEKEVIEMLLAEHQLRSSDLLYVGEMF